MQAALPPTSDPASRMISSQQGTGADVSSGAPKVKIVNGQGVMPKVGASGLIRAK